MAAERVSTPSDDETPRKHEPPSGVSADPGEGDNWEPTTEHRFSCKLCGHLESWTTETSMRLAASWHLKNVHPEDWAMLHIDPDITPDDPAWHGSRFEDWERQ